MWTKRLTIIQRSASGFTLIEILTAVFILSIVASLVLGSFDGIFSNADHINISTDQFEMGNNALERITLDLSALHAKPYPRYQPPDIDDEPELFHVIAEQRVIGGDTFSWIRFTSLAHLPFNQQGREGIAQLVYYVTSQSDGGYVLKRSDALYPYPEFEEDENDPVVCEQVQAFELTFYDHEGQESQDWDSEDDDTEYATPRAVGIRLAVGDKDAPYVFRTQITLPVYRYQPVKR